MTLRRAALLLFFLLGAAPAFSAEPIENGRIRLLIDGETGRFSLFYLADLDSDHFEPLFNQDPRNSFLAVQINDRIFKLGGGGLGSASFRVRVEGSTDAPEIIFDSPGITVRQRFTFIAAGNSEWANGVSVAVTVINKGDRPVRAGIRFLLDTSLGEDTSPPFHTDLRPLAAETLLTQASPDQWWISRDRRYGLMGSINSVYVLPPSSIHFAGWRRLDGVNWTLQFSPRNFRDPGSASVSDAAVSWIFDAEEVAAGGFRVVELLLAAENSGGFGDVAFAVSPARLARNARDGSGSLPSREEDILRDLEILRSLMREIDGFEARGEAVPEEKMTEMELTVARVRERYGIRQ